MDDMGFAVLRFEKVKTERVLRARGMHNHREGRIPAHVDRSRTSRNEVEGNALSGFRRLSEGVKMRKNGVLAVEAVVSFSPEKVKDINVARWKQENLKWFAEKFGKENILETALHLDEKTPHLHIIFAPRVKGKWNCREILGGKLKLRKLQDEYALAMEPFGLERGRRRKGRTHIPAIEYRSMQEGRRRDRRQISNDLASYLGQEGYRKFLVFLKEKQKRDKEVKKLEKHLLEEKPVVVSPKVVKQRRSKPDLPSDPTM